MAPIPKRSSERIRRNKVAPVSKIHAAGEVVVPDLGIESPDPLVMELWVGQHSSAQRQYMESSDWAHFKLGLRLLDEQLKLGRKNANLVQVIESIFANHGVAEGHRRKLRIEVERVTAEVEQPTVASASYKRAFGMEAC